MRARARVAFVEGRDKVKAIASAGAWGFLKTWERLLEQALHDRVRSLLVIEDDVVFYRDFLTIFGEAAAELPADWAMLRLGSIQYDWESPWLVPAGRFLHRTTGAAIGAHAVGLRSEAMPFLLERVRRMELPFDIGALSGATREFADRCFVIVPNLAIQRLGDSDINSSGFRRTHTLEEVMQTYRWNPEDYVY